jgi:hypothetical protein
VRRLGEVIVFIAEALLSNELMLAAQVRYILQDSHIVSAPTVLTSYLSGRSFACEDMEITYTVRVVDTLSLLANRSSQNVCSYNCFIAYDFIFYCNVKVRSHFSTDLQKCVC